MPGLTGLGLSELDEQVYRHFLKHPGESTVELGLLLGATDDDVETALHRLVALGVVHGTDEEVVPHEPAVVVERLAERRLTELHAQLRGLTRIGHLIGDLEQLQPDRRAREERLPDVGLVRERLEDLAFFAREEVLSIESYRRYSPDNIAHARPLDLRCLRRGVAMRSLVHTDLLLDGPSRDYVSELAVAGLQVRHARDVAERVLVYDRRTAVVPVDPADTSRGALVLHDPALVSNLVALFERAWAAAATPVLDAVDDPRDTGPSELERAVLRAMCAVSKDEVGARAVGVSVRTYRRYVADLMQALGATGRPQAALRARERGWV